MTDNPNAVTAYNEVALVKRSQVPQKQSYLDYKHELRHDFFHSCAYCTMSEAEAQAVRFTIDHYEPRNARPDLTHKYENLMWTCEECNRRKGDRCPPEAARQDGNRFFRPDYDYFLEHFERVGILLRDKTRVGWYTIHALDLNRQALRRLREIRQNLQQCDERVTAGILALTKLQIDRLPVDKKGKVLRYRNYLQDTHKQIVDNIDAFLRYQARSPFLDEDQEQGDRSTDRQAKLANAEALYPGQQWRAPRQSGRTPGRSGLE